MLTDVSEMRTAFIIALIMEAVRISETSVNINLTIRRHIPEDSKLHIRRRENLISHKLQTNKQIHNKDKLELQVHLKVVVVI
jgi:hypothetical protein